MLLRRCATTVIGRFLDAELNSNVRVYSSLAQEAADSDELYSVLNRLLGELQVSHLLASTPQQVRERSSQQVGAVGLRGREIEGATVVIDVLPSSPAERAGVGAGWIVTELNGIPLPFEGEGVLLEPGQPIDYLFIDALDQAHAITLDRPASLRSDAKRDCSSEMSFICASINSICERRVG